MKVIETLTEAEIYDVMSLKEPVGIFEGLIQQNDAWVGERIYLACQFYIVHSSEKTITKAAEKIVQYNPYNLGEIIRSHFIEKWTRVYNSLIVEYEAENNLNYGKKKTGTNTDNLTDTTNSTSNKNSTVTGDYKGFNADEYSNVDRDINTETNTKNDSTTKNVNHTYNENNDTEGRNESAAVLLQKEINFRKRNIFAKMLLDDVASYMCLGVY